MNIDNRLISVCKKIVTLENNQINYVTKTKQNLSLISPKNDMLAYLFFWKY